MKKSPLRVFILFTFGFCLLFSPSAGKSKVVLVANSLAVWKPKGMGKDKLFPAIIEQGLGDDFEVISCAKVGGTVLRDGNAPYWKSKEYKKAMESEPDFVTIQLGSNDAKGKNWKKGPDKFKEDYLWLINQFQNLDSKPQVVVVLITPSTGRFGIKGSTVKEEIVPLLKAICEDRCLPYLDLYTMLEPKLKDKEYFYDGVHVGEKGAKAIGDAYVKLLKELAAEINPDSIQGVMPHAFNGSFFPSIIQATPRSSNVELVFSSEKKTEWQLFGARGNSLYLGTSGKGRVNLQIPSTGAYYLRATQKDKVLFKQITVLQ